MLDEETGVYYTGDKKILLTLYETMILSTLIMNKYRVVTFSELSKEIYLDEVTPTIIRRLQVNVCRIKKKLRGYIKIGKKVKIGYYLDVRY